MPLSLMNLIRKMPLFWQLYITIILALLLGLLIIAIAYQKIEESTDYQDFYGDTRFIADIVNNLPRGETDFDQLLRGIDLASHHDVRRLTAKQAEQIQVENQQVDTFENDVILQNPDGRLLGLYPLQFTKLTNEPDVILVSDPHPSQSDSLKQIVRKADRLAVDNGRSRLRLFGYTLVVSLLATIALALYWQARRLQGYLQRFVTAGDEWLAGNTDHTIDAAMPAPLNEMATHHNQLMVSLLNKQQEQQMLFNAVSHEIRTPLSKLHLSIDLMQRDISAQAKGPTLEELAGYVDELDQLTDQVLTLSKLRDTSMKNRMPISTERIRLNDWMDECVNQWRSLHGDREFEYATSVDDVLVNMNPTHLLMLIDNLLANAVKYGKNQIAITQKQIGTQILITIADDGPGIPVEQRDTVLLPFSRLDDSRRRETGGYGIGLAVVNAITQHYEISLKFEVSQRLGGLQATVRMPFINKKSMTPIPPN